MPIYEVQSPDGRTFEVEGASMPSADELESIFKTMGGSKAETPKAPEKASGVASFIPGAEMAIDLGKGALAGLLSTAYHGGDLIRRATGMERVIDLPESQAAMTPPDSTAGKIGFYGEQIGEFLAPGAMVSRAVKGARLPIRMGAEAASAAAASGIQSGGDVGATGSSAVLGAAIPAVGALRAARGALRPPVNATHAEAVRWALNRGIPVDAATASGNRVVRGAKAVADHSIGGAIGGKRAADIRSAALARTGAELAGRVHPAAVTPELAGAASKEGVEGFIREQAGTQDEAYARVRSAEDSAQLDDVPVSRPVASGRTVDQGFIGHWLADDLNEMGYQAGGGSKQFYDRAEAEWLPGDADAARRGIGVGSGRVAGTPTQEMFHAAGVSGSRQEIALKIRKYLTGESSNPRIGAVIDAMGEAWDGQRFDWDLLTDETLARTGIKRNQFKSPVTMPAMEAPGAVKFFGDEAPNLSASGTEPMPFAVPLASLKEALRPVFARLQRKKELVGQLMGDEARAATALDAIISGPDHAPLSVVDAALGDLKAAARGAAMPELRTAGQGLAAKAVSKLEGLVQTRAKAAGVWDDLRAGRDATIAKWTAKETLDKLGDEPVKTFRMLTSPGDAAIERLREVQKLAPREMPKIGRAYLDGLFETATGEGGFSREAKLLADWNRLGSETKAMLYPDESLRSSLDKFFLIGKKMAENPNPSGTALVSAIPGQAAWVFVEPVSGVSSVIGAAALSKLLNSPTTARLMVDGLQIPRTSKAAKTVGAALKPMIRQAVRVGQVQTSSEPRK